MDEMADFFSLKKDFKREAVASGYVSSRQVPKVEPKRPIKREFVGTDYGEEHRRAEMNEMKKVCRGAILEFCFS